MKICFSVQDLSLGGSNTVVHDIIMNWNGDDELYLVSFFNNFDERYKDLLNLQNLHIVFLGKKGTIDFKFLISLKKTINQIKPDIISSHLTCTFYLKLIGIQKGCTLYHTIHSEPVRDLPFIYRLFLRSSIKKGKIRLIGCCKYIANNAMKLYKTQCLCINNGIDQERTTSSNKEHDKTVFLFVGRLDPIKNVSKLIDGFNSAKSNNTKLIVCGFGHEEENIINQINKSPKKENITYTGKVNNVEELYLQSDVICLISEREGLPMTILEGLKYGLAFLVTDVGGICSAVTNMENGIVLENLSVASIASAMDTLTGNPLLLNQFKSNSLQQTCKFDAINTAKSYRDLFYENR